MNSFAKQIIDNSIKSQKVEMARNRRRLIYKLLDYYNGDNTEQYLENYFKANAFQEIPTTSMNITKRFIDRLSRVYTLGASRTLGSNQEQYDNLTRLKDLKLKHFEKKTNLLGTLAVEVSLNENNGVPYFDYNPKYAFDVELDPLNPLKPIAIKYPIISHTDDATEGNEVLRYAYYDDQGFIIYDENGKELQAETHNMGVLPFVFLHRDHHQLDFFVPGAIDIMSCNEMVNILFSEMNLGMRFQMFGQYTITGLYQDEKFQRAGSDEIIILPEGADLDIVAPDVNVGDAIKLAKSMLEIVAANNHLTIAFEDNNKERPQSGIALKIRDIERQEDYQDRLELWSIYEQELYNLERISANTIGINLPDTVGIDFNEPSPVMTTQEEIMWNDWMIANNMTTKAQLLQKYNKDLSLKQAEKIIEKNKEINGSGEEKQTGSIFNRLRSATQETE